MEGNSYRHHNYLDLAYISANVDPDNGWPIKVDGRSVTTDRVRVLAFSFCPMF